jgi:hypothetical protein
MYFLWKLYLCSDFFFLITGLIEQFVNTLDINKLKEKSDDERRVKESMEADHICDPSYSGGRDQENFCSRPVWVKLSWHPISTNRLGIMVQTYHSSHTRGINRRILVHNGQV